MEKCNVEKEYVYLNNLPYCIINGNHREVLSIIKKFILPLEENVYRILLVDEFNDKYYHYEVIKGDIKRLNCVCLPDLDRELHRYFREVF